MRATRQKELTTSTIWMKERENLNTDDFKTHLINQEKKIWYNYNLRCWQRLVISGYKFYVTMSWNEF